MAFIGVMRFLLRKEPREEELAALADGSIARKRRVEVEAMVDASPELAARLAEQRRAVAALRGAASSVAAPADLRARIPSAQQARVRSSRRRRYAWGGGLAVAAVAVLALVLALALPESVPGGPTVAEAAVVAVRPAAEPAPPASSATLLARDVEDVVFPNWARKFGWKATGLRVDTIEGRSVTTVFYEKHGRRVGYTIIAGSALKEPTEANVVRREGTELRLLRLDGRRIVTWQRRHHTCILSGAGVDAATLTKLAAWKGRGTVAF